jgi:hypothetical protein
MDLSAYIQAETAKTDALAKAFNQSEIAQVTHKNFRNTYKLNPPSNVQPNADERKLLLQYGCIDENDNWQLKQMWNVPINQADDEMDDEQPKDEHFGEQNRSEPGISQAEASRLNSELTAALAAVDSLKAEVNRLQVQPTSEQEKFLIKRDVVVQVALLMKSKIPVTDPHVRTLLASFFSEDILEGKVGYNQKE